MKINALELSQVLGKSLRQVQRDCLNGKIKAEKFKDEWLIDIETVKEILEKQKEKIRISEEKIKKAEEELIL